MSSLMSRQPAGRTWPTPSPGGASDVFRPSRVRPGGPCRRSTRPPANGCSCSTMPIERRANTSALRTFARAGRSHPITVEIRRRARRRQRDHVPRARPHRRASPAVRCRGPPSPAWTSRHTAHRCGTRAAHEQLTGARRPRRAGRRAAHPPNPSPARRHRAHRRVPALAERSCERRSPARLRDGDHRPAARPFVGDGVRASRTEFDCAASATARRSWSTPCRGRRRELARRGCTTWRSRRRGRRR